MKCIYVLFLCLLFFLGGCAPVGTIAISSAFGLAGRGGLNYFNSGSTDMILYRALNDVEHAVEGAFTNLTYKLERKQIWSDKTIRIIGVSNDDEEISLQVCLRPVAKGITEIEISARHGVVLPEKTICHLLMKEIMDLLEMQEESRLSQKNIDLRYP